MLRHWSIATAAAIAVALVAAPLAAQRTLPDTAAHNATLIDVRESLSAPSIVGERTLLVTPAQVNVAIDTHSRAADRVPTRASMSSEGSRNPAMMIVGGAAIIVGAVVGGNGGATIAVAGGVIGLVGLWNYLK